MFDFCAIIAYGFMSLGNRDLAIWEKEDGKKSRLVNIYDDRTLMNIIESFCYTIPSKFIHRMMEIGQKRQGKFSSFYGIEYTANRHV